jgi:hypothetical protein
MECPFELPVRSYKRPDGFCRIRGNNGRAICKDIAEKDEADYIVQAINCHEKLREAIEAALRISDLWTLKEVETMFENEAKALAIMKTRFEQALKEKP